MYSEIIAYQIAEILGSDNVKYEMVKGDDVECVKSRLFTLKIYN